VAPAAKIGFACNLEFDVPKGRGDGGNLLRRILLTGGAARLLSLAAPATTPGEANKLR